MNFMKLTSKVFKSHYYIKIGSVSSRIKVPIRCHTVAGNSPGSGAGKGGGAGGAIRQGGGGLGKFGAAQEDGYFYDKQREQLQKLKSEEKLKKLIEKQTPKRQ